MGFEARGGSSDTDVKRVDYDALNEYMLSTCNLQQEKTMVGIISGIIDLGLQQPEDAKVSWVGSPEAEAEAIAKMPGTYFEDDKNGDRWKRWKQRPVNAVAFAIDIPSVIVDKAPFFDAEPNPAPLRLILNGKFWRKEFGIMDVGKIYSIKLAKNEKTNNQWSFMPNSTIYKMAVGAGIATQGSPVVPQDIIKLLGVALLFKVRVWKNDAGYYNEKIAYAAGLIDGMSTPEYNTDLLYSVGFQSNNDTKAIQYLSAPIINRMKMSSEYEGSAVREQIEEVHPYQAIKDDGSKDGASSGGASSKSDAPPATPPEREPEIPQEEPMQNDNDEGYYNPDDIPF